MADELIFKNAQVVSRRDVLQGSVRVSQGLITEVCPGDCGVGGIDFGGDYLLPGLVEVHTDNLERHLSPRTNTRWPAPAALIAHDTQVAGVGITTVLDAICVGIIMDNEGRTRDFVDESVAAVRAASEGGWLRAEHFLHFRCELPGAKTVEHFAGVCHDPRMQMVSLMDHTPGHRQIMDLNRARRMAEFRRGALSDEEWYSAVAELQEEREKYSASNRCRILEMLDGRKVPLASHDDTFVEHVEEAAASGIRIAEFPTTIEAARAAQARGMKTVMGAPNVVLGSSQSGNASAREAAQAGLVDCLSSDYAPVSLLHAAFLLASEAGLPLAETVAMVTANPAEMIGLGDRGAVEPGRRADLIRVRMVDGVPRAMAVWRQGRRVA